MVAGDPGSYSGSKSLSLSVGFTAVFLVAKGGERSHDVRNLMKSPARSFFATYGFFLLWILLPLAGHAGGGGLESWVSGGAKDRLVAFVEKVTTPGAPGFVPPEERLAVFDNDGTLLCEQPNYVQFQYALDRLRELAPKHPEWTSLEPFRSVLEYRLTGLRQEDDHAAFAAVVAATMDRLPAGETEQAARRWIASARNPALDKPVRETTYVPMLELLDYLRGHQFTVAIVSGGTFDFIRAYAQDFYGVEPGLVVGSRPKPGFQQSSPGIWDVVLLPEEAALCNGPGKPQEILARFGRRPILAFGNSDGDVAMLQWTTSGPGPRLGLLLHHDDAEREFAYDRDSAVGQLKAGLDEAAERGWIVVSMKRDWKRVFADDGD